MLLASRGALIRTDTLDYSVDAQHTAGINLEGFPVMGLLVPVLNNTPSITLEISIDGGSTWLPLKTSDGNAAITVSGGAAAFALGSDELTQLAAYCARLRYETNDMLVRLALSTSQTADRVFTWVILA